MHLTGLSCDVMVVDFHTCLPTGRCRPRRQEPHALRGTPMINKPLLRECVARRQQQRSLFMYQMLDTRYLMESPQQLYEGNTMILLQTRGQRLTEAQ